MGLFQTKKLCITKEIITGNGKNGRKCLQIFIQQGIDIQNIQGIQKADTSKSNNPVLKFG
jgi:hypothetical protein